MKRVSNLLLAVALLAVVGCATTLRGKIVQTASAIDDIVMPVAHAWADYVATGLSTPEQNAQAERVYTAYVKAFSVAQETVKALDAGTATPAQADEASAALTAAATEMLDLVKLFLPPPRQTDLKFSLTQ